MPRPRTNKINRYDKTDQGTLIFNRSDVEAEIDIRVDDSGKAYVGNPEFIHRRVKILIMRD
jgi:hypothetical protein